MKFKKTVQSAELLKILKLLDKWTNAKTKTKLRQIRA